MTLLIFTFAASVGIIIGAYWFFVLRLEGQERAGVSARLKTYREKGASAGVVMAPETLSSIPWLNAALSTRHSLMSAPKRLLVEAGLTVNIGTFLLACFASGALGFLIGYKFIGYVAAGLILCLLTAAAPYV